MRYTLLGVMLTAVIALTGCSQSNEPIVVENGWVRALPPGAKMTAGYASVTNNGDDELRMLGVSSPNFGRIEMHSSYLEDGVQQMRMVDGYKIAPGETLTLASGGDHLMMRFPRDLGDTGSAVPISVAFRSADGELVSIETTFELRQNAP